MELVKSNIENKIYLVRGVQVMLDSDLAELYNTETKFINRAVKRNASRFPIEFMFQLTEKGITMLSAVLHTDFAFSKMDNLLPELSQKLLKL